VLELIYHTPLFGPMHFEYSGPVVRVGRSEDNDLVLRHPSVAPHHCVLVFRGERVLCLPPDEEVSSENDLGALTGPEFGVGDEIVVGELRFGLTHSAKSVAIPEVRRADAQAGIADGEPATEAGGRTSPPGWFCAHCRMFVPEAEVVRLGLVGHSKRYLCPKCSTVLDLEPSLPTRSSRRRR
jgi:hypothetical protein